jgi:hypothetical protein
MSQKYTLNTFLSNQPINEPPLNSLANSNDHIWRQPDMTNLKMK